MRLRRLLLTGAAGAAALLAIGTAATAAQTSGAAPSNITAASNGNASDSLRSLAADIGLRIGSAIIPQDIETPSFAAIASSQFSVVTPGNAMKWEVVEPTEGTFDWSQADQLVAFAQANHQLVRGHTLLWHSQLPTWLTDGVANGTISNAQLTNLLHQHITTEVSRYKGKIWQ